MQWRSVVVGLVVLRVSLGGVLWLAFGLGPGLSSGFDFPLGFSLHRLDLLFRDAREPEPGAHSWSGRGDAGSMCRGPGAEPPRRPYPSLLRGHGDEYARRYGSFPDALKAKMKGMAREMFYFGYDNYMKHAFPADELNPIECSGRGPDVLNP